MANQPEAHPSLTSPCLHCGSPVSATASDEVRFCCAGCKTAHAIIGRLGLDRYYRQRQLDPSLRPPKPEETAAGPDGAAAFLGHRDGVATLNLFVEGLHCGACVWLIESVLAREAGVIWARLSMSTGRLVVRWRDGENDAARIQGTIATLGYRAVPFDPERLGLVAERQDRALLRAMAVAGFAAANVMLLSVGIWAGHGQGMAPETRALLHWVSALIAIPAIAYSGRPFFASALAALKARRTNMDVPIALAVIITPAVSLFETFSGGRHAYFDSSVTLLFFLLIGRYLDARARGRARSAAQQLVSLGAAAVTVLDGDGRTQSLRPEAVKAGMTVLVPAGGRIGVDGRVAEGASEVDTSLVTGESAPVRVRAGDAVFAGFLNFSAPLRVSVTASGDGTLLAEIVRLMEAAESGRGRYVALADRVARLYSPVVHLLAALTFIGWTTLGGLAWQPALLIAVGVLIITCPCALALAVPVVQVVASGRLMRQGILMKSATALERLARVDPVVFDKTGTLTEGRLELLREAGFNETALAEAAAIAAVSTHPLARALARAVPGLVPALGVRDVPGQGLALDTPRGEVRLGSRAWCGVAEGEGSGPELWLARPGTKPTRFLFHDRVRQDAAEVVQQLTLRGYGRELLSGDRAATVAEVAAAIGIETWQAAVTPANKVERLAELARQGRRVLMVGDGLNDAPALAAAYVSMSPSSAADVSQTAADLVFQGRHLAAVTEALAVAKACEGLVRQNLAFSLLYNALAVPLAVAGLVTPLIAAVAMSSSSMVVILNAMRLGRRRRT